MSTQIYQCTIKLLFFSCIHGILITAMLKRYNFGNKVMAYSINSLHVSGHLTTNEIMIKVRDYEQTLGINYTTSKLSKLFLKKHSTH